MSTIYTPAVQTQGPAEKCTINGKLLGWFSCSACGMAIGIDSATMGRLHPAYCTVRRATGDVDGGLTLPQVATVATGIYGVKVEQRVGTRVCTPAYAAGRLHSEHPFELQGNTKALLGTKFRSTGTAVNHLLHVERGRGWHSDNGLWRPSEVLVFDPAADHRRVGWGTAAEAWDWWPWGLALSFAAGLHPWGESDGRLLGPGKFYAGIVEPQYNARYSSKRSAPYPDRTRARFSGVRVHSRPDSGNATVTSHLDEGELFVAYQYAPDPAGGSLRWAGSRNGRQWVREDRLRQVGGAT